MNLVFSSVGQPGLSLVLPQEQLLSSHGKPLCNLKYNTKQPLIKVGRGKSANSGAQTFGMSERDLNPDLGSVSVVCLLQYFMRTSGKCI